MKIMVLFVIYSRMSDYVGRHTMGLSVHNFSLPRYSNQVEGADYLANYAVEFFE